MLRRWSSDEVGYGSVLLLIVATYSVSVTLDSPKAAGLVLILQMIALGIVLRVSHARPAVLRLTDLTLIAIVVGIAVSLFVGPTLSDHSATALLIYYVSALLYGIAPFSIIRHALTRPSIDSQTLLAAIASYLMIGMFFAFTYRAIAASSGIPFFGRTGPDTVSNDLFFSFVTLTTTGYGDLVPARNPGQTLAVAEAIIGQLFLVTAVAKVVNQSGVIGRLRAPLDPGTDPDLG
jgi:hypothetical protein